jgi:hypothetical protein
MRISGFGCGGSSDDFFQREHSGGLVCHHCKICRRAATKEIKLAAVPPDAMPSPAAKARSKCGKTLADPGQAFELLVKALLQVIRNCK